LSRLAPFDKALVLILVPLWVVCFALGVRTQVRGGGVASIVLTVEDADHYPVLTGEFDPVVHESDPLAEAGLRAGDRLIQVGDADLRGVGTLGFVVRSADEGGRDLSVPLVFERNGERRETALDLASVSIFRPLLANALALVASALFLLLRGRPTPTVRAWFYFAMCAGFANTPFLAGRMEAYACFGIFVAMNTVYFPLLFNFLFRFPDDRAPEGRWHRIWPWFFAVPHCLFFALLVTSQMAIAETGFLTTVVLACVALLAVATYKYRRADRIARRQMKWVLFGFYCAGLSLGVGALAPMVDPRLGWLWFASFGAAPLLPLSLLISVVRFNLFDIDRLLSATASYNVLLVLLAGGGLVVVPRLGEAASGLVGIDPAAGQVVLSLALAALLIPAHRGRGRRAPRGASARSLRRLRQRGRQLRSGLRGGSRGAARLCGREPADRRAARAPRTARPGRRGAAAGPDAPRPLRPGRAGDAPGRGGGAGAAR
jgi:hypothetical protein